MRLVYKKETKSIVIFVVDDNSITSYPPDCCVIQSEPNSLVEMSLALGLNIPELIEHFNSNEIPFAMTPQLEIILRERAFGINLCTTIIDRIKNIDNLTNAQRLTLLNTIKDGMNALQWGDMQVARGAFNAIATTALYTQARKDWVILQIDNFLNN